MRIAGDTDAAVAEVDVDENQQIVGVRSEDELGVLDRMYDG